MNKNKLYKPVLLYELYGERTVVVTQKNHYVDSEYPNAVGDHQWSNTVMLNGNR